MVELINFSDRPSGPDARSSDCNVIMCTDLCFVLYMYMYYGPFMAGRNNCPTGSVIAGVSTGSLCQVVTWMSVSPYFM